MTRSPHSVLALTTFQKTAKNHYSIFDQIFTGKDNFENHNMTLTSELLNKSCELNGVKPGDFPALFKAVEFGSFKRLAKPNEVAWPAGINQKLFNPALDLSKALKTSAQ